MANEPCAESKFQGMLLEWEGGEGPRGLSSKCRIW